MFNPDDVKDESGRPISALHGVTLAQILEYLVKHLGWAEMADRVPVNCFSSNPTVKSSLNFLRRTPWARKKVETIYIELRTDEVLSRTV